MEFLLVAAVAAISLHTVVASALSSETSDTPLKNESYSEMDQDAFHQSHLIGGAVRAWKSSTFGKQQPMSGSIKLSVSQLSGKTLTIMMDPIETIAKLKSKIAAETDIAPDDQKITFAGRELDDGRSLSDYNIQDKSELHLVLKPGRGVGLTYFLTSNFHDKRFDYDFTNISDEGQNFMRGDLHYKRPCGWQRIALNVLDKYGNNDWLGVNGRKSATSSVKNEWPVSYHGTSTHNCNSIAEEGYLLDKSKRFAFGHGIYSSPDIDVARRYATKFTVDNIRYIVVLQNRVNPQNLVKIPKEKNEIGEYWISPNDRDLRPYGICIKKE